VDPMNRLMDAEKNFQKSTRKDTPTLTIGMCFETFQETLEKHVPNFDFDLILEFGDYRELLQKMQKGIIDLVSTPHKIEGIDVTYRPFSQENIVLVAGKDADTKGFSNALDSGNEALTRWLKSQKWYGITGDNEHLRRFWQQNFGTHPDFRPNYIVPNIHSIVASLTRGPGLGVIPDFLCLKEVKRGDLTILWRGHTPLTNTLYLARKKDGLHQTQLDQIETIMKQEMPTLITP